MNHITEQLRLEGTSGDCVVPPHCSKQDQLNHVALGHMQSDFEPHAKDGD